MKNALALIFATFLATSAVAAESDATLMEEFSQKSEICRGESGDSADTWQACAVKEQAKLALVIRGYCQADDGWQKGKPANDDGECQ